MKNNKKVWISVVLILVCALLIFAGKKSSTIDTAHRERLIIGAILSMTGPTAIYGEQLKTGMELALRDLDPNHTIELRIEDSKGEAQTGITAFNLLSNQGAGVFVSNFSRVSLPLRDLAKRENKPLVMTLVSAMSAVDSNTPSNIRIFHNAETVVAAHMKTIEAKGFKSVGLIYVNDEFGSSIRDNFEKSLDAKGITLITESFTLDSNDYRTQIQKMKSADVDVIMFATIPPATFVNFIKQRGELKVETPVIDIAGILAGTGAITSMGTAAEGMYSFATPFDLGLTGADIRAELDKKGMDKTYPVAFGYDAVKYIIQARDLAREKNIPLNDAISQVSELDGLQGVYLVKAPEILPTAIPVQLVGGKFVEVR